MANFMTFRVKGRTINAYIDPALKEQHKRVLQALTQYYTPTESAGAYIKKKPMCVTINKHVNDTYFVKTDIKGFFDNIDLKILNSILEQYVTNEMVLKETKKAIRQSSASPDKGILQGSVLAALLSNMYMIDFDTKWEEICNSQGVTYTRYSDDMTFSSKEPIDVESLLELLASDLNDIGLTLNTKKTQVINKDTQNHVKILGVNIIFGKDSNYLQKPRRKQLNTHQKKAIEYINHRRGNV